MFRKLVYISTSILCSIVLFCCKPQDPLIPFEGKKIAMYCLLMPDTIIEVHLVQSQAPLDKGDARPIEFADVILYQAEIPMDTLEYMGNGTYTSSANIQLQEGGIYHIQAKAFGFPDAVSMPEQMPNRPKITTIITNDSISTVSGNVYVAFAVAQGAENSLGLAVHCMESDTNGLEDRYSLGFLDGCPEGGGTSNQFFSCFGIDCSTNKSIYNFEASRLRQGHAAHGWLAYTSKAFLDFHTDYQRQYDATLDPIFYEPLNVRSNVQGGYGAVVAFSPTWFSFSF